MDKIRLSLVGVVVFVISWALVFTDTYTDPVIEAGPVSLSLPYILAYGSIIFLVWLHTPILENIVKFFMNGTVMKVLFFIILIFGVLAIIDVMLIAWFGWDLGIISAIKGAWS